MIKFDDINKLKFTKIRDWRINFKYDGVQYSLNHVQDCESVIRLINLDTKKEVSSIYGTLYVNSYIKVNTYNNYKKPLIYSHIDKKDFIKELCRDGLIEGDSNIKREIILEKMHKVQKEINEKQKILNEYLDELLKIE